MKKQQYLACIFLLCQLAACLPRPSTSGGEPVMITFACYDYEQKTYESQAKMFHAQYPNITVQIVAREPLGGMVSTGDLTRTAQIADTFIDTDFLIDVDAPQNMMLNLTPFADQDKTFNAEDFYPGALDAFRSQGKLWGVPVSLAIRMIFYDRDIFKENGAAEPKIGWTWQEFLETATALTRRDEEGAIQYGYVDTLPLYTLPMLAHQKAQPLVNPNTTLSQVRIDRPEIAEALQWYADLTLMHDVMPNPNDDDEALSQIVYKQKPAMWAEYTWEYTTYRWVKGNVGVVPFPEARDPATTIFIYGAFVSAGTTHPEAAWQWINFLSQQPPHSEDNIPARKSVGEHSGFWRGLDKKTAEAYRYALDHISAPPDAVVRALFWSFNAILAGTPAQQALNEQQSKMLADIEQAAAEADQPPVPITVATPFPTPRPGATTVRFMMPYSADRATYRILAQRFQDTNTDIAIELIPSADSGQFPADSVDAWAGPFPDDPTKLLPLDAFVEAGAVDLSGYPLRTLEALRQEGKLLGLPFQVDATLLYYNRDLFELTKTVVPAAGWTPEHFVKTAVALTDGAGAYGFYPDQGAYSHAADFVAWMGGTLFDENGTPTFDDPTVIRAVASYVQLLTHGAPATARSEPPAPRFTASAVMTMYGAHPGEVAKGGIAMWTHNFQSHKIAPPTDFATGVAPFLPDGVLAPDLAADNLYISAKTRVPEAAWAWLSFLSAQPEAVELLPLNRDVAANSTWEQHAGQETAAAWCQILEQDYGFWPPTAASSVRYLALHWFDQVIAEALNGGSVEAALTQAQISATTFVNCCAGQAETTSVWTTCARQADPNIEIREE